MRRKAMTISPPGLLLGMVLALQAIAAVDRPQPQSGPFATPLTESLIDNATLAESADGAEHPLANPSLLRQILWTQTAAPSTDRLFQFGASAQPGPRHLRLGFTSATALGSVLVRGGDQLSVLRSSAAYPGNLNDDSQWLPAQRIVNRRPSQAEFEKGSFALWVLPAGTKTRAIRFTHIASQSDSGYAGVLGGVYLLAGRYANLAPQATVAASANQAAIPLLTDEQYNNWHTWDNGPTYPHPVTVATPEWITLTWPHAIPLRGLAALWAGFNAADAQTFTGPDDVSPQGAPEADWQTIGAPHQFHNQYPRALGVDWLDFGKTIQTRAVRLRITQVTDEAHHPHLAGKTRDGNRIWLGELMAISPLDSAELQTAIQPQAVTTGPRPPIPVAFRLDAPGYVSLVIDDAQGNRVRNLISDTWFEAGSNTVWWDGTDDLGRNPDAAAHGVYLIPTHFVEPGRYTVRGLVHNAIDLHYEFTVYNSGNPAWDKPDGKGGWLTNHTPPSATLFVPADKAPGGKPLVYLGSYISEGGSGLAWVDLEGHKQGGRGWVGATWTGAPYLARDTGTHASPDSFAFTAAVWGDDARNPATSMHVTLRVTALTGHGDKAALKYAFDTGGTPEPGETVRQGWMHQIGGLAVHDNLAVVSLTRRNELLFADLSNGKVLGVIRTSTPRGAAFDARGNLLVLSDKQLLEYNLPSNLSAISQLPSPQILIDHDLDGPAGLALDMQGNIYISDRGSANQVKVFNASGQPLRVIGHAGPSQSGSYDALHMNSPRGLAIDGNNQLWVAEDDFQPKRVSVWTLDGKLVRAFYGPPEYGGGGALDPQDKSLFYYHAMQFKLDWKTGANTLAAILYRPGKSDLQPPLLGAPVNVLYSNGHRYFTNSYLDHTTNGVSIGTVYLDEGGKLRLVAALGKANDWILLQSPQFRSLLPPNADLNSKSPDKCVQFTWSDTNNNGQVDPEEVTFRSAYTGAITAMSDAAIAGPVLLDAIVDGKAMRYEPIRMTPEGIPVYDLQRGRVVADGVQKPRADGGGQMLTSSAATVLTTAPLPFAPEGVGGIDHQGHRWSYPSLWPGLHPAHSAPVPDRAGLLVGTTRLLGGFIYPSGPEVGPLWGINGNFGDMYLFTADGLFVTQLFQDVRTGKPWNMPHPTRNMLLNDVTLHDENFFPTLTQTSDGNTYVVDGNRTSIVRVDGLNTLHRLAPTTLDISKADIARAEAFLKQSEESRQQALGVQSLSVPIQSAPVSLSDWLSNRDTATWITIDRRIAKAGWADKPDLVQATVAIQGQRLFAAFRTNDPKLLQNAGTVANAPFKTGGALDLMIGTDPHADPKREKAVAGDIRLLVYQVNKQTKALLYRAVVPGTTAPIQFAAPDHSIYLDEVKDVSSLIQLEVDQGNYAISIPLEAIGLKPAPGIRIKADLGILRGNGSQTTQRVYWSNKATGITSDVPSEAELTPSLWGEWIFRSTP